MLNISNTYKAILIRIKNIMPISIFLFFIVILFCSFFCTKTKQYSIFVEFSHAHGVKEGTSVNYRGIKVGTVARLSVNLNKVVILLKFNNNDLVIPSNSIIEVNQTGIFNDIVISIIPSADLPSRRCYFVKKTDFLTHNSYIKGYKGISYDDLIRSTTRISQRFDDPRFFSLFYLLLKNSIYFSDDAILLINNFNSLFNLLTGYVSLNS